MRKRPLIAITPEVGEMLAAGAVVAFGVSGGKDSTACAIATSAYLDSIGHPREKRVLIHADLGVVEWADSHAWAERLAAFMNMPLMVVRRPAGGLMERWESRWAANVHRYENLECVTVIPPWSTAALRFCTSEMKVDQIARGLKARFPGESILSVSGIRREEGAAGSSRAKAPVSKLQPKLTRGLCRGVDWHPIASWLIDDVLALHDAEAFPLHPAYGVFGSSRVSCSFCILARIADHHAAATDVRNHETLRRMVGLELRSAFSLQSGRWLADLRPDLLTPEQVAHTAVAKAIASRRAELQARIPKDLLYVKGWPTFVPSVSQAELIAGIRCELNELHELECRYLSGPTVRERYAELIALKEAKAAANMRAAA